MNASAATSTEQREAVTGAVAGKGPACRGGVPTLSSHRSGKCSRISRGSASAAMTTEPEARRDATLSGGARSWNAKAEPRRRSGDIVPQIESELV